MACHIISIEVGKLNKKMLITGIALLLICVGLSGCQVRDCPDVNENKPIPVGCIYQYPDRYLNETITVQGRYVYRGNNIGEVSSPSIHFGGVPQGTYVVFPEKTNMSEIKNYGEYFFTGVLEYGELVLEWGIDSDFYIEVIRFQPVK